ncbi:MAG: protein-glutamate O-methyltransferase [Bacteroidales bacterium]|nr:protein-glutamate O-methyltransferase [Bacteroidales bacterium]
MDFNPIMTYKAVLEEPEFNKISKFINANFGIKLPDHKRIMIQGRLVNRLVKLNFQSFEEYTKYVFSDEGKVLELPHMIDLISTNKTEFYRESIHFEFLKDTVIPHFINNSKSQNLKIWSAACSSGEEVYSIAMEVNDVLTQHQDYDYSVLGTDISTRMLTKALKAIYPLSHTKSIPLKTKKKYFLKNKDSSKDEVRIKKILRDKVSFLWHNLMDENYNFNGKFDVIFCRNVLIYFSKKDQMHVLQNLSKKLNPGAYLFLGHSESITHLNLPLVNVSQTVFQKQ